MIKLSENLRKRIQASADAYNPIAIDFLAAVDSGNDYTGFDQEYGTSGGRVAVVDEDGNDRTFSPNRFLAQIFASVLSSDKYTKMDKEIFCIDLQHDMNLHVEVSDKYEDLMKFFDNGNQASYLRFRSDTCRDLLVAFYSQCAKDCRVIVVTDDDANGDVCARGILWDKAVLIHDDEEYTISLFEVEDDTGEYVRMRLIQAASHLGANVYFRSGSLNLLNEHPDEATNESMTKGLIDGRISGINLAVNFEIPEGCKCGIPYYTAMNNVGMEYNEAEPKFRMFRKYPTAPYIDVGVASMNNLLIVPPNLCPKCGHERYSQRDCKCSWCGFEVAHEDTYFGKVCTEKMVEVPHYGCVPQSCLEDGELSVPMKGLSRLLSVVCNR